MPLDLGAPALPNPIRPAQYTSLEQFFIGESNLIFYPSYNKFLNTVTRELEPRYSPVDSEGQVYYDRALGKSIDVVDIAWMVERAHWQAQRRKARELDPIHQAIRQYPHDHPGCAYIKSKGYTLGSNQVFEAAVKAWDTASSNAQDLEHAESIQKKLMSTVPQFAGIVRASLVYKGELVFRSDSVKQSGIQ